MIRKRNYLVDYWVKKSLPLLRKALEQSLSEAISWKIITPCTWVTARFHRLR
jgi:hypothetical protein